jgi:hypothetical protein
LVQRDADAAPTQRRVFLDRRAEVRQRLIASDIEPTISATPNASSIT